MQHWCGHQIKKKKIRKVERIQRAATKLPQTLRDCTYGERQKKLGLTTLGEKRKRRPNSTVQDAGGIGERRQRI